MIRILRSGIHGGEEPQVLGNERSGMVVFSGCHLACSFCYTPEASFKRLGHDVDAEGFTEILATLLAAGARNINLISPTHVWGQIEPVLVRFKQGEGRHIPLVLKFSGFEPAALIDRFAQVGDLLVPDFKVVSTASARAVNLPGNYGPVATKAIARMVHTHGETQWDGTKMRRGMIVRHLMMPGFEAETQAVVDTLSGVGYRGYFNLMTNFVKPGGGLAKAEPFVVRRMARLAREAGMHPLIDAREVAAALHPKTVRRAFA